MADLSRFRSLTPKEQAIVTVAVLIDGHDAPVYLLSDRDRRAALSGAADDFAHLPPELRLPLVGTLLRRALERV